MRPLNRRWTPEEDELIRSFVAKGASAIRVSAALKRHKASVTERARKLGCPFQSIKAARKRWENTQDHLWRQT
jgi:hypothetical protein